MNPKFGVLGLVAALLVAPHAAVATPAGPGAGPAAAARSAPSPVNPAAPAGPSPSAAHNDDPPAPQPQVSQDAPARSRMHECGHQWSTMKKNGTVGTLTWKEFSATCLVVSK